MAGQISGSDEAGLQAIFGHFLAQPRHQKLLVLYPFSAMDFAFHHP
jgi:hypothetical protein